jgi:hypothetical protein
MKFSTKTISLLVSCLCLSAWLRSEGAAEWDFQASKPAYLRYELVELTARPRHLPAHAENLDLEFQVTQRGEVVESAGERTIFRLHYYPVLKCWKGKWPIPWNPEMGSYQAELFEASAGDAGRAFTGGRSMAPFKQVSDAPVLARAPFEVKGRVPLKLPAGFSVVTLEPGKTGYRKFSGVHGEPQDWRHIIDWADWMGADAFWHLVGETQLWRNRNADIYPWEKYALQMSDQLAAEAHRHGLAYGAYMLTFRVLGPKFEQADYKFTTFYSVPKDAFVHKNGFISLDDPQRAKDLIWLLKKMDSNPNVDYLGFDYLRTDFGGLEFTDQFLRDMDIRLPAALKDGKAEARQKWLGRIAVMHTDEFIEEEWEWWRSHKVAEVVSGILAQAQVHKPLWVFSLGWMQGHQHGQDPFMLIDAGISFNSPMFYEANQVQYPAMIDSWSEYLEQSPDSLVIGEPVDGKLLSEDAEHFGPERHFERQKKALDSLGPLTSSMGFFWHDISRAMVGGRGRADTREWAVAGAASFSLLRERQRALPLHAAFHQVSCTAHGAEFEVEVENLGDSPVARVSLEGLPVRGVGSYQPAKLDLGDIPARGKVSRSWKAVWTNQPLPGERKRPASRRMLAVKVGFEPGVARHAGFSFTYVDLDHRPEKPGKPLNQVPEKRAKRRPAKHHTEVSLH